MPEYTIDHDGIDGRWRVTWIRPDGYGDELLFGSEESARAWADTMSQY